MGEITDRLSVIIPSRTETYLSKTVVDLLEKAKADVEVIVVLDGYWPENCVWEDKRVTVVHFGINKGMRACINAGVELAKGGYIMKTDEHCMFDQGYDVKLKKNCDDDWVVIPRRYRLDADNWKVIEDGRPPVDYMNLSIHNGEMHGWKNDEEYYKRKDILIDETMSFQGSCYFMKKKFWKVVGPMDDTNYGPFANEAQEIGNRAWLSGGKVVVNKKTWYAHWRRKSARYGFTHQQQREFLESLNKGRAYCTDYWVNNGWDKRVHDYQWLVDKFKKRKKE